MLVDEDWVPVGIAQHQAGRTVSRFVSSRSRNDPQVLELALNLPNVLEGLQSTPFAVPARVEGQHVLLEHALEQPDVAGPVLQDQPVLGGVAADHLETEVFVESARRRKVLDRGNQYGIDFEYSKSKIPINIKTFTNLLSD